MAVLQLYHQECTEVQRRIRVIPPTTHIYTVSSSQCFMGIDPSQNVQEENSISRSFATSDSLESQQSHVQYRSFAIMLVLTVVVVYGTCQVRLGVSGDYDAIFITSASTRYRSLLAQPDGPSPSCSGLLWGCYICT